jgi:hypothetical protein
MAYWTQLFLDISEDFARNANSLIARIESQIPGIQSEVRKLKDLVEEPFQLSRPFYCIPADHYRTNSQLLMSETIHRIGYSVGYYAVDERGIFGLFWDRFKHLSNMVTRHTDGVINRIQTECPPIYISTLVPDDEIVYGIVYRMVGSQNPKELLDRMFRVGSQFVDDGEATQYYWNALRVALASHTQETTSTPTPIPTPAVAPTPQLYTPQPVPSPSPQLDMAQYIMKYQRIIDIIRGYGQAISSSYHEWCADLDQSVTQYYAQLESQSKALYDQWKMTDAQLFDKIRAQGDKHDGSPLNHQPIGISTGMTSDGKTAVVVTLAGLDLDSSELGHGNDIFHAIDEGATYESGYTKRVHEAILQYLAAHNLPPDTPLILNGHSLGGMVAQDLIAKYNPHTFNIIETNTYGSPDQGARTGTNNVKLNMYYFSTGDEVPRITWDIHNGVSTVVDSLPINNPTTKWLKNYAKNAQPPELREHSVTLPPGVDPDPGRFSLDYHSDYGKSPTLQNQKIDFTITSGTEYYSA